MRELFLTSFDGIQYGIWKDEILAVRNIRALHRIPLSPARIAGIMIEDGRTVTLADLPACIGHEPSRGKEQGCILLTQEGDEVFGFVISGELRTQSIPSEMFFPLPVYLRSMVSDTCAVHDDIPIPVINIAALYSGLLNAGVISSTGWLQIADAKPQDISGISRLRYIDVAGDLFAVSAGGIEDNAATPGPVTPLPNTPQYVQGVTFHDGRLLPVIDLALRIKSQRVEPDSLMLTAWIAGSAFGLLIGIDAGVMPADEVLIKSAPLISQTSWMKHIVLRTGELIPLVDLALMLTPAASEADNIPVWQRYAPDSGFPDMFFRQEAEVVEFSLLGARYALPKQEVEDIIAFKPCRVIPDVPPIVIGLAEHKGEILPVIDPAMMFGRRSIANSGWRMMLVNNGDFRALVITETVFGEHRLPVSLHRAVPVHLPHNLMYGCYPDGKAVRIILNIEAISVHFEKSMIQIFMPALSQQMRMSPTGVVYTFPDEKAGFKEQVELREEINTFEKVNEEQQPSATITPAETAPPVSNESAFVDEVAEMEEEAKHREFIVAEKIDLEYEDSATTSSQTVPEFKRQAELDGAEFVEWEEAHAASPVEPEPGPEQADVAHAAATSASTRESLRAADESRNNAAFEQAHASPVEEESEKPIVPETNTVAEKAPERTDSLHSGSVRKSPGKAGNSTEHAGINKPSPLEELRASAKKNRQKVSGPASADSPPAEPVRILASAKPGTPYRMSKKVEHLATLSGYQGRAAVKWKRRIAYGTIVALLISVLFYFAGSFDKSLAEKSGQATEPPKTEQVIVQREKTRVKADRTNPEPDKDQAAQVQKKVHVELEAKLQKGQEATKDKETLVLSPLLRNQVEPPPAEQPPAPLELDIPKNRPTDIDVYVVQEGDTLWSISERFTGNPLNYPRIAGENRIADPDLIFPEQRIRLIK
jgi:chemotaxis signal transduction protein/nucleoid-associated protein YgaU